MEQSTAGEMKYLKLLAREYQTIAEVSTEIINLKAILGLPKGTEHFISDIHGEYEAFLHMLKNASGVVRVKVDTLFENSVTEAERNMLATLIYYPEEKLDQLHKTGVINAEWYKITLRRLVEVARLSASKYTRSKVRKALPQGFEYIIDELLHCVFLQYLNGFGVKVDASVTREHPVEHGHCLKTKFGKSLVVDLFTVGHYPVRCLYAFPNLLCLRIDVNLSVNYRKSVAGKGYASFYVMVCFICRTDLDGAEV